MLVAFLVGYFHHAGVAATCQCNDFCLLLVELCVEHLMWNLAHIEHLGDELGDFHRCGTHEYGASVVAHFHDFVDYGSILCACCLIYAVVKVLAENGAVGGNFYDIEFVDVPELTCFCRCRTCHTGEFVVHTEVVLQCDGGECLCGSLHFHMLLGFYGLMESVAPTAAFHDTSRLFIDNLHFAVHHNILVVLVEHGVCLEQLLQCVYAF